MPEDGRGCSFLAADGSVDAWTAGWHVHFPADRHASPTFERASAPKLPQRAAADGVRVDTVADYRTVQYGRWLVLLGVDDARVVDMEVAPRERPDTRYYLKAPADDE